MNTVSALTKQREQPDFYQSMLAHDIKSPINQVKGLLYVLRKQVGGDEEISKILDLAIASNEQLYTKVENLLHSSTFKERESEEIDFPQILLEIERYFSSIESIDNVKVIKNIDKSICFFSDAVLIQSIIQNIVENAVKYRKKSSKECLIIFSVQQIPDHIVIKISDNGRGIDDSKLPHIFERSYRATKDKKGSGVGLYLVKKSLDELNASISVDSKLGSGSTFTITLPYSSLKLAN